MMRTKSVLTGLVEGGICVALVALPPIFLAPLLWNAFIRRTDGILAQSAPIASHEATLALKHEVQIGSIRVNRLPVLTMDNLVKLFQQRQSLGILPLEVRSVRIASGKTLQNSEPLLTAETLLADVSVPALLTGDYGGAVPSIRIDTPYVLVIRNARGRFNLQDITPPQKKQAKPLVFRSIITAQNASVLFRDASARFPKPLLPAINQLVVPNAELDLMQTRRILFNLSLKGRKGSPTVQRIGGLSRFSGSLERGEPDGTKADAPSPDAAKYILNTDLADIDIPYWMDYLFDLSGVEVKSGRGSAHITAIFPYVKKGANDIGVNLSGEASVRDGRILLGILPAPITAVSARAQFAERLVLVDGKGGFLGAPVGAEASLWNLGGGERPQINARLRLPRFPTNRYAAALFGRGKTFPALPKGLQLGSTAMADVTLQGALTDPIVSGRVGLSSIGWQKYPSVSNLSGGFAYARGVVGVTNVIGTIGQTGKVTAQVAARLAESTSKGLRSLPATRRSVEFQAKVNALPLAALASFVPKANRKTPFRLSGTGAVDMVGALIGTKTNLAANITTDRAAIDSIRFSDARARIVVENGAFLIPFVSIAAPVVQARIHGNINAKQNLSLRWNARGVDMARIGKLLGLTDTGGILSGYGTIDGTVQKPRLIAESLVGLGLRYQNYRTDIVKANFTATPDKITLGNQVKIYRFPAVATLHGIITKPLAQAQLNIGVDILRLPYAEIWAQSGQKGTIPVAGFIAKARATVGGSAKNPQSITAAGDVNLGETVIADYPVSKGGFHFDYAASKATARNVYLETPFGTATGIVTLLGNDRLRGSLIASGLDLARTPGIPQNTFALEGKLAVTGTLSGTLRRPTITVAANPSNVRVAGIPLSELTIKGLSYTGDTKAGEGRITASNLSFGIQDSQFTLFNGRFDQKRQRFGANLTAKVDSIASLLTLFQSSPLTQTPAGASLAGAIGRLPKIDGAVTLSDFAVTGRIDPKKGITDTALSAEASAQNVSIGRIQNVGLDTRLSLKNEMLTVERLTLADSQTTVLLRGTADFGNNGQLNMTLDSNEASLDLLREFIPNLPLSGTVNVTVTAQGNRIAPRINASLDSNTVVVRTGNNTRPTVPLSLVQIRATLKPEADGNGRIVVDDSRIVSGTNEVDIRASLPFSYKNQAIIENQPVEAAITLPPQNTAIIAALVPGLTEKGTGDKIVNALYTAQNAPIAGAIALSGTLAAPQLSGDLTIQNLAYTLPHSIRDKRDTVNSLRDIQARLRFDGANVIVQNAALNLGGLNGDRGDYGTVSAKGQVTLQNLQNLLQRNRTDTRLQGVVPSVGDVDLAVKFDKVRAIEDNLLGGLESVRATLNGNLLVKGALEQPIISTTNGQPVRLSNLAIDLPRKTLPPSSGTSVPLINPRFDIRVVTDTKATLSQPGTYRFDATGTGSLAGTLSQYEARASLAPQSGFYQYGLGRFRVNRGGELEVQADTNRIRAILRDVTAQSILYTANNATPSLTYRASQGASIAASSRPNLTGSSRYKITLALDGTIVIGEPLTNTGGDQTVKLTFTSDPSLSTDQILALIGTQQQIELAARGDVQTALRQGLTQALTSNFVPGLLSGFEESVASAFGFEEFGLDFGLLDVNAPLTLNLIKRFPDPFSRFLLNYQRTIPTRNQLGQPQPYLLSVYYELRELRPTKNIRPRLQVGISQDDLKTTTYFLRGAVFF